jgi:hypothetical protein
MKHIRNFSMWEVEAEGTSVQGQSGLRSKTLSQKKTLDTNALLVFYFSNSLHFLL